MADEIRCNNPLKRADHILLGCHRGDRTNFPENTMPAFRAAVELGLDAIETDVRRTKDDHLILIHDRSVERTTNGIGNVDEMTLAEIRDLDAGFWKGDAFIGERIPTVEEFLEYISKTDLVVNWELKEWPMDHGEERPFKTVDLLVELIDRYGMAERSIMNSFSERVLEYVAERWPGKFMIHSYPLYKRPKDFAKRPLSAFSDWFVIWKKDEDHPVGYPEDYEYAAAKGIPTCILVPDREEMYRAAVELGCKMFTSDDPAKAVEILKKLGFRA